jgi:hypothetical protein
MFRKLVWSLLFAAFAVTTSAVYGQETAEASVRVLQTVNDNTAISVTLQDGRTVLSNLLPGSVSAYFPYEADRSTRMTLRITPPNSGTFTREWTVPPLAAGHHTIAIVGNGLDNTVDLIFVDEVSLCAGRTEDGACVIFVNNLRNSPPLRVNANSTAVVENAGYRQAVVGEVDAASYFNVTAADQNNALASIFRLQLQYFEPNVVYVYTLRGSYPAARPADYIIGTMRRVTVDTMTFLRGLTADLQLSDSRVLFAAENITAILDQAGYAPLIANSQFPLTVFAPLDEAVVRTSPDLYECALTNPDAMRALILNHIVAGAYTPQQLVAAGSISTMGGTTHTFRSSSGGFIMDNRVQVADAVSYPTANGQVYLIDDLLVPPGFEDEYCAQG